VVVTFSLDGQVLVSTMREPTLHAWQLANQKDLPMPGYPSRVRSVDWTASGRFLATSGSDRLTLLTFQTQDNPLARMPLLLAPYRRLVAAVACHPTKEIAAVGYEDGLVLLVRIPDGAEIMVKAPDDSPITAMRWYEIGTRFGIASESGRCRIIIYEMKFVVCIENPSGYYFGYGRYYSLFLRQNSSRSALTLRLVLRGTKGTRLS
jgi:WD40 repeat protein